MFYILITIIGCLNYYIMYSFYKFIDMPLTERENSLNQTIESLTKKEMMVTVLYYMPITNIICDISLEAGIITLFKGNVDHYEMLTWLLIAIVIPLIVIIILKMRNKKYE